MAQAETTLLEDDDDQIEELEGSELEEDLLEKDQDDLEGDESDDDEDQDGDEGQEIVLDGDDGSHPENENHGIRKRVNKLNAKVVKARKGEEQSTAELEVERERNRLLQLALDQQGQPVDGPPNPDDFDDGVSDAEYIKANNDHITKEVAKQVRASQQTTQVQTEADSQLQIRQTEHYKKADTLKVKDYDETEDIAIDILGQETTNQVISNTDKSPEVLYYLGKNPEKAKSISSLLKSNPVKGVLAIGRLEARLIARPKARKHAPSPDTELSGGGAGNKSKDAALEGAIFE